MINLLDVGGANAELTLRQQADGYLTAVIAYPPEQTVQGHLDEFFAWYGESLACSIRPSWPPPPSAGSSRSTRS